MFDADHFDMRVELCARAGLAYAMSTMLHVADVAECVWERKGSRFTVERAITNLQGMWGMKVKEWEGHKAI